MTGKTKIVVARQYPKPGRLQEIIDVYAKFVPLAHKEPGCELFSLHTDGETMVLLEKWTTLADLQSHSAGLYLRIRAEVSDLIDRAPDVWIVDNLPFGDPAKGTVG